MATHPEPSPKNRHRTRIRHDHTLFLVLGHLKLTNIWTSMPASAMQSLVAKHRNMKPCFWLLLDRVRCNMNSANRLPNMPKAYSPVTPICTPVLDGRETDGMTGSTGVAGDDDAVAFVTASSIGSRSCSAPRSRSASVSTGALSPRRRPPPDPIPACKPDTTCNNNNNNNNNVFYDHLLSVLDFASIAY
ncbi:hypothetical protein AGLY_015946 [Aphis glycines]|uniref:Uncharacterized protein n=1 Tax=Aphis glycines TaxID=307491 RepID=A0A6G0SZL0_APHGL|nr:hypothetical protein AGLY_015946 [Aphis glycines]